MYPLLTCHFVDISLSFITRVLLQSFMWINRWLSCTHVFICFVMLYIVLSYICVQQNFPTENFRLLKLVSSYKSYLRTYLYVKVFSEPFLITLPRYVYCCLYFNPLLSQISVLSNFFQKWNTIYFFIIIAITIWKLGHSTNQCQAQPQCQLWSLL